MQFIVRYTDKDGKKGQKIYDDYSTVIKAKKWLIQNGYIEVDIAVKK